MTPAQIDLLQRLIAADRSYRSRQARGDTMAHYDERGGEVGGMFGASMRTARVLEDAGLIEIVNIHGNRTAFAFLGKYRTYDLENED